MRAMRAMNGWGVVLMLAGITVWAGLYGCSRNSLAAENQARYLWPTVKGTTLSTKVSVEGPIPLISEEAKDYLTVEFGYEVEGVGYRGKQKWVLGDSLDPGTHVPAGYSGGGKTVIVYYNPTNPADAFVEPRLASSPGAEIAGAFSMAIGIPLFVLGLAVLGSSEPTPEVAETGRQVKKRQIRHIRWVRTRIRVRRKRKERMVPRGGPASPGDR